LTAGLPSAPLLQGASKLVEIREDDERAITDATGREECRQPRPVRTGVGLEREIVFLELPCTAIAEPHLILAAAVTHPGHELRRWNVLEVRDRAILRDGDGGTRQHDGGDDAGSDHGVAPTRSSGVPATGTNNGWPYFSTPNVLMTFCVAGATMKSANVLPPVVFTLGPLAGFTSITE